MAGKVKDRATEARFNFAGGVNYAASQDTLATNELLLCRNARIAVDGSVERRTGWNKLHAAALGAAGAVRGLCEWTTTGGGRQLVAIANGKLYYSDDEGTSWTEATPTSGAFSSVVMADFAPMVLGGQNRLFIASGGNLFLWTGTGVTVTGRLNGTNGVPSNTHICRVYRNRLFVDNGDTAPGFIYWSKLGDGTDFQVGGISDGGSAAINGDSDEQLTALEVIGNSLLVAMSNSIARLMGTGSDIEILTDTSGVTNTIGPVHNFVGISFQAHPGSFQRTEQVVEMWTDRGPYIVTEGGVVRIGDKIDTAGLGASEVSWRDHTIPAYVVYHRARNETWYVFRSGADSAATSVFVYSRRHQCWSGPFQFPVGITSTCQAVIGGVPTILAGCADGFVRLLDDPSKGRDDGTTDYTHTIQFPPFIFPDAGPHNTKSMRSVFLEVEREDANTLPVVKVYPDNGSAETLTLVENTAVVGAPTNLRYDSNSQGKRFVVEVSGSFAVGTSGDDMKIIGLIADGSIMERW